MLALVLNTIVHVYKRQNYVLHIEKMSGIHISRQPWLSQPFPTDYGAHYIQRETYRSNLAGGNRTLIASTEGKLAKH